MTLPEHKLIVEPFDFYIQNSEKMLTSHALRMFMTNPRLYWMYVNGKLEEKDGAHLVQGHASHTLVLEPDEYPNRYALGGPINPKTGKPYGRTSDKFKQWEAAQGKPILTAEEHNLCVYLAGSVKNHPLAKEILSDGLPERTVKGEIRGCLSKARMDWYNPEFGITDLKTCRDIEWFAYDAKKYGYHIQLAFHRMVFRSVFHETVPCHIIAVEKKEPYTTAVYEITEDTLREAEEKIHEAIGSLVECVKDNDWPTGYEEKRELDFSDRPKSDDPFTNELLDSMDGVDL